MPHVNVLLTIRRLIYAGLAYEARKALTNLAGIYALGDIADRCPTPGPEHGGQRSRWGTMAKETRGATVKPPQNAPAFAPRGKRREPNARRTDPPHPA